MKLLLFVLMKAHIVLLFFVRCPAAIGGRVAFVVVDSIKSFPVWALSHISEKVSENLPTIANRNSASSVFWIRQISWISASLHHSMPRLIGRGCRAARWAMPMRDLRASAGSSFSATQLVPNNDCDISAIASTLPNCFSRLRAITRNNHKAIKALPNYVFGELTFHRGILYGKA